MQYWQGLSTSVAAFLLGAGLLARWRTGTRLFGFVALSAGAYVLSLSLLFATYSMSYSPAVIVSGAALLGFSMLFALSYLRTLTHWHLLSVLPLLLVAALAPTDLFVADSYVDAASGKLMPVHGPGAPALVLLVLAYCTVIWYSLWRAISYAKPTTRVQSRIVFAAFSLLILSVLICNVALPVAGLPALNAVTGFALLLFLGLVGYALTAENLFDVQLVVYKSLSYGFVPVSTFLGSVAAVAALSLSANAASAGTQLAAALAGAVAGALFSQIALPSSRVYLRKVLYPDLLSPDRIRELVCDTVEPLSGLSELRVGTRSLLVHLFQPERAELRSLDVPALRSWVRADEMRFEIPSAGAYVLHARRSGEPYTNADARLAEVILPHLAAAAHRALEHDAIAVCTKDLAREVAIQSGEIRDLRASERRLVADIAHGLQTPLAVLRAEVESTSGVPEAVQLRVNRAVDDLVSRVRSLITYARAGVPLSPEQYELVRVDNLLREIADYVRVVATERGVDLVVERLDEVTVQGRKSDLETMLTNVLSNALEHAERGHAPHKVFISLSRTVDGSYLTVADTGPGMADHDRVRAFEPLYRGRVARAGSGMGLGLAIAKQVATAHGGTISLGVAPRGGLLVEILLPALND
jgi:signal transduction histidine kinase